MKKIFYVLATVVMMALVSSCGCRSTKTTECCTALSDSTSVVVDTTVVAADTVVAE